MPPSPPKDHQVDPLDALLTLEDTLYTHAYTLGVADGAHAGRIEGRIFGLEKGFDKFAELGQLHGRSVTWGSRLPGLSPREGEKEGKRLPSLPPTERLRNNTTLLHSLTDPETFDTANTEEAVADFDDRFKRAGAKAKVIERIVGETDGVGAASPPAKRKSGPVRVGGQSKSRGAKEGDDSMEDFAGSKLVR